MIPFWRTFLLSAREKGMSRGFRPLPPAAEGQEVGARWRGTSATRMMASLSDRVDLELGDSAGTGYLLGRIRRSECGRERAPFVETQYPRPRQRLPFRVGIRGQRDTGRETTNRNQRFFAATPSSWLLGDGGSLSSAFAAQINTNASYSCLTLRWGEGWEPSCERGDICPPWQGGTKRKWYPRFDRARLPQDCDPDAVGRGIFANEILPRTSFRRGAKGEKVGQNATCELQSSRLQPRYTRGDFNGCVSLCPGVKGLVRRHFVNKKSYFEKYCHYTLMQK